MKSKMVYQLMLQSLICTCFFVNHHIVLAQELNLREIQVDLKNHKNIFTNHYNKMFVQFKTTIDSITIKSSELTIMFKEQTDSLNSVIIKNQTLFDSQKNRFNNFLKIRNELSGKLVAIIKHPREAKFLNRFTSFEYPVNILKKERGNFTLYSLDASNDKFVLTVLPENKKISKIYNSYLENNKLEFITSERLLDMTNAKKANEYLEILTSSQDKLNMLKKQNEKVMDQLENDKNKYSLEKLNKKRISDSLELIQLIQYYNVEYPNLLSKYENELEKEKIKDKKLLEKYKVDLAKYEALMGWCKSKPTEEEAIVYFNQFKRLLKDPYSAILETYGVQKFNKVNEEYPCIKFVLLGIRAKNSWGAYGFSEYFLAIKDGQIIDYGEAESIDGLFEKILPITFEMNSISCANSNFSKPIYPLTAEERVYKPIMRNYDFKFN
jgi:hypothetical protein